MRRPLILLRIARILTYLLICKTIVSVSLTFRDYFPPNFRSDFLLGRDEYFFGPYQWAFYAHILTGPFTLIMGLVLVNDSIRRRLPKLHRCVGRTQVACVLLLTPSGLWMAWYADTGTIAAASFATLAIATALCVMMGWRSATQQRFKQHRCWMLRCFVLLCSAIVLRIIGGLAEILSLDWTYPFAAWLSWLVPLIAFESLQLSRLISRHPR